MAATIRRNLMLREYDIKENGLGQQTTFSIKFIKANGEVVFFPKAAACGLSANMSANRIRGIVPLDAKGDKIGHPTPVSIDAIIEWNNMEVIL